MRRRRATGGVQLKFREKIVYRAAKDAGSGSGGQAGLRPVWPCTAAGRHWRGGWRVTGRQGLMTQARAGAAALPPALLKRAVREDEGSVCGLQGSAGKGGRQRWVTQQCGSDMPSSKARGDIAPGRLNFKAHPRSSSQRHDSGIAGGTAQNEPEIDLLQRLAALWGCGESSPHRIARRRGPASLHDHGHDVQKHRDMACPAAAVDPHPG